MRRENLNCENQRETGKGRGERLREERRKTEQKNREKAGKRKNKGKANNKEKDERIVALDGLRLYVVIKCRLCMWRGRMFYTE